MPWSRCLAGREERRRIACPLLILRYCIYIESTIVERDLSEREMGGGGGGRPRSYVVDRTVLIALKKSCFHTYSGEPFYLFFCPPYAYSFTCMYAGATTVVLLLLLAQIHCSDCIVTLSAPPLRAFRSSLARDFATLTVQNESNAKWNDMDKPNKIPAKKGNDRFHLPRITFDIFVFVSWHWWKVRGEERCGKKHPLMLMLLIALLIIATRLAFHRRCFSSKQHHEEKKVYYRSARLLYWYALLYTLLNAIYIAVS